jgi:aspartate aminotransferase
VFPEVTGILNDTHPTSESLAEGLLDEAGVAVVPGTSFGAPGFIRLSYALADEDLERGVERMVRMFGRL